MTKKVENKCSTVHERPTNNLYQKDYLNNILWPFICKYLTQVAKLQRASLQNPVKVEVSSKYQTVDKLQQYYLFIPVKYKVRFCLMTTHIIHVYKIYTDDRWMQYMYLYWNSVMDMPSISGCLLGVYFEWTGWQLVHGVLQYLCKHSESCPDAT